VYDTPMNDTAQPRRTILGRAVVHPNFSADTARYDYMLYAIEPVTFPHLKPIELNDNDDAPAVGENVTVIGYGLTSGNFTTTDRLLKASLAIMNTTVCHDVWVRHGNPRVYEGTMLCTAGDTPARGPCLGAFQSDSTAVEGQMPASGRIARTLLCPLFSIVILTALVKCRIELILQEIPAVRSSMRIFDRWGS
jgi:Trypsin